jgi:hypothetical protein
MACVLLCAAAVLRANPAHAQEKGKQSAEEQAVPTGPPPPEQLFFLESEAQREHRLKEAARRAGKREPIFPKAVRMAEEPFYHRAWPHMVGFVEPSYVCYGRLYFEQINFERYGWDLGPISPLVSLAKFYIDTLMFPYNLATDPCRCYECSNCGYCLPGSPVPLMIYPPEFSATGTLAEAAAIAALFLIFP